MIKEKRKESQTAEKRRTWDAEMVDGGDGPSSRAKINNSIPNTGIREKLK